MTTTVNLPVITGDQLEDQWKFEVTEAINSGNLGGSGEINEDDLTDYVKLEDGALTVDNGRLVGYAFPYLDVAYGTDENGSDFSDEIADLPASTQPIWQGRRNTTSDTASSNPVQFTWVRLNSDTNSDTYKAYYRLLGGRQIDWVFSTTDPGVGYTEHEGEVINLESAFAGQDGANAVLAVIEASNGTVFKEGGETTTTLKTSVYDGGSLRTDSDHNGFHYQWLHKDNVVCVNVNREVLTSTNGGPLTATLTNDVWVCPTGFPADNGVEASDTQFGGDLREIIVDDGDVDQSANFVVNVSNIGEQV